MVVIWWMLLGDIELRVGNRVKYCDEFAVAGRLKMELHSLVSGKVYIIGCRIEPRINDKCTLIQVNGIIYACLLKFYR